MTQTTTATTAATAQVQPIEVTDDAGVKLVLQKPAQRVISLAPSNTETVVPQLTSPLVPQKGLLSREK